MRYRFTIDAQGVDRVHHVVERMREPVNVFTVDGRHERAVEPLDDLVRDEVALVLDLFDLLRLSQTGWSGASISSNSPAPRRTSDASDSKSA
jgi:hypothetical protein